MTDASLYDTDFVRWSEEQAGAIRHAAAAGAGANLPLDWANLAAMLSDAGEETAAATAARFKSGRYSVDQVVGDRLPGEDA